MSAVVVLAAFPPTRTPDSVLPLMVVRVTVPRAPLLRSRPFAPLSRIVVSVTRTMALAFTEMPDCGRLATRQFSTVSTAPLVMLTPLVPPLPGKGTITRLRSATLTPGVAMTKASPPRATTLPSAPGTARIVTDLVTATGPVL
jgi:hypothetical protein